MKTDVLFLAILVAFGAASQPVVSAPRTQNDGAALVTRSREVIDRLASGDVGPIVPMLNDTMKSAADASRLRALFPSLVVQAGAYKGQTATRTEMRGEIRVVVVTCAFERGDVEVLVAFDAAGRIAGLTMRPGAAAAPATPFSSASYAAPAAFREEAATVDAGGWALPGAVTVPVGPGPFPAVVLVHGSGPGDRDATFGPNKPFRDLAEGFASRGIVVLRYDKRTRVHAARTGPLREFTPKEEVIDDAVAAVRVLLSRPDVRADRVFVLGHSFGGMLAPRIALAEPKVAGLVVMAGNTRPMEEGILAQTRYLSMLDGQISQVEQSQIDAAVKLIADVKTLKSGDPPLVNAIISAPSSYWLDLRGYDPPAVARSLAQPMLILQGERDYQVTMADDFAMWQKGLSAKTNAQFKSYPGLNHLMMTGTGRSEPSEYGRPGHVEEAVVLDIAAWIKAR